MIDFKVTWTRIQINVDALQLEPVQRRELGEYAIATLKQRVARGLGSNDTPMPPLTRRYKELKARRVGSSIRDLRLTGAMLENLTVRSVDPQIAIDFTSASARAKALKNEQHAPWFSFSPADMRKIAARWWILQGRTIDRQLFLVKAA